MATKCIKVTLEYITKENNISEEDFNKELKCIQYKTYKACNRAMTYQYTRDMQNIIQKDIGIPKEDDKVLYGKSFQAYVENRMNEIMEGCLSNNVAQTRAFAFNRYTDDKKRGLLKGNVSLSQFKRDIPVIVHNKAYSVIETSKGLGLEIGFFNIPKQKELDVKRIKFLLPNLGGTEKATLRRIFDGSYKLGTGQITYNERKRKWQIAISYSFEIEQKSLNQNLIMGVDLGITKVATMSIYDAEKQDYKLMSWKEVTIDGTELIHYRQKIEAKRKAEYIASKWASENNSGRGYKARTAKANATGDKYNRFKETYNHKVSRYIVDLAEKYNFGCIQMEDLSGFSAEQSESLLKNWSYYDLQNKVKYKAIEKGIKVVLINPQYTSKRCNRCGCIHTDNRNCKEDQASFKCVVCGHTDNADVNASKNIAIPDIENIIKEFFKK